MNETLETLNLSGNVLNKESGLKNILTIAEQFHNNYLFISQTVLTPLMRTIGVFNQNLQVLILQWNGLSGKECANIFKNLITRTEGLKVLDISWNK